jgi:hypothetical protein
MNCRSAATATARAALLAAARKRIEFKKYKFKKNTYREGLVKFMEIFIL